MQANYEQDSMQANYEQDSMQANYEQDSAKPPSLHIAGDNYLGKFLSNANDNAIKMHCGI